MHRRDRDKSGCVICPETKRVQVGPAMAGRMDASAAAFSPSPIRVFVVSRTSGQRRKPHKMLPVGREKLRGAVLERSPALGVGSTVTPTAVRPPSTFRLSANGVRGDRAFVLQEHLGDLTARRGRKLRACVCWWRVCVWYGRISGTVRRAFRSLQGG